MAKTKRFIKIPKRVGVLVAARSPRAKPSSDSIQPVRRRGHTPAHGRRAHPPPCRYLDPHPSHVRAVAFADRRQAMAERARSLGAQTHFPRSLGARADRAQAAAAAAACASNAEDPVSDA